ncbi:hypothetical protein SEQ_HALENA_43 [Mycobacterium phage Halena]|uniref:Uncharacterized protein n=1 Tax=Mycobacterium phage Halena TaxID=2517952 RepID=A0A482J733_9CAUD|nr:hypothetical protein SEQ_HALENA_43 [Mycobacterium phage Halena]
MRGYRAYKFKPGPMAKQSGSIPEYRAKPGLMRAPHVKGVRVGRES